MKSSIANKLVLLVLSAALLPVTSMAIYIDADQKKPGSTKYFADPADLRFLREQAEVAERIHARKGELAQSDFQRIMHLADTTNVECTMAYAILRPFDYSRRQALVVRKARQQARSPRDVQAYNAICLLRSWHKPEWRDLALEHKGQPSPLMKELVQDASKPE